MNIDNPLCAYGLANTTALATVPQHRQRVQAAAAADGYLRSDPTQHEAWEIYRWGYLDQAQLVCRVFPLGLLLENRIAAGDDCGKEVDGLFELYARNRFHYFDTPTMQPPDTDTLALMLRLSPHGRNVARCRQLLEVPLRWLMPCIEANGDIPVFMTRGLGADAQGPYLNMTVRRCASVQAGLLSGLLTFDAHRFEGQVATSALHTLQCFAHQGGGGLTHYDAPYGAFSILALVQALRCKAMAPALEAAATWAEHRAVELLLARRSLSRITALDAALLQLASGFPAAAALHDGDWVETLMRMQRPDGSWEGGPLYLVPIRGNRMGWYASRRVTTALAYRALNAAQAPGKAMLGVSHRLQAA